MNVRDVAPLGAYQGQNTEALFFLNPQGEFTFLSEPFARLIGHAPARLLGQSLAGLLASAEQEVAALVLEHAQRGEVLTLETRLLDPSGEPQPLLLTTLPQLHQSQLTGIVGIARPAEEPEKRLEARALSEVIFGAVADVIFVLQVEPDEQYRFRFINRAFEITTGLAAHQVNGRPVQDIIPEPSLSLVRTYYRQAIETGQRVTWQEISDYPTGRLVGEVAVTPVYSEADDSWCLVGTVHDLTAQKRVEEDLRVSNERFAYALKATSVALYDWDIAADALVWGEGFKVLFGYKQGQEPATIRQWATLVHPEDAMYTLDNLFYTIRQTQQDIWQREYRFRRADDSWAIVLERGCLIRDETGQAMRMIGTMQDITERQEAEEKQHQMTQELFRQNADLQQFTYIVSHNLRAPLANARGFADLLPRLKKDSEAFDTSLEHLATCLQQLDTVITDVNSILSIRDKVDLKRPEPVALAAVCEQMAQTLAQALRDCGGTITCLIPEQMHVDGYRAYVCSIFLNLLANAIKYRSDERALQITVTATQPEGQGPIVTVLDNGMGFDLDKAGAEVFQLYKRFHAVPAGRGMGLFLVKAHIEAMGGRVEVSSRPNEGTQFTLFFA